MAKRGYFRKESQLEGFAADLGSVLGTAAAKADRWLGQRQQIVKQLTEVRDTATKLLADLGHAAEAAYSGKRRGRPPSAKGVVNRLRTTVVEPTVRVRRKLSKKARAAISAAQKKRWALQKAAKKK